MAKRWIWVLAIALVGCAQPARYGMVEDPQAGLMWGSAIERNLVFDASQLENRKIKINLRNVSGDAAYDLTGFHARFAQALRGKGFTLTEGDDFGVKFDVNVLYSGYARTDLTSQFAFLGGAAGAISGAGSNHPGRNMAAGALAGATLGAIIGSHTRDETYVAVAEVTVAIADQYRGTTRKSITFSASPPLQETLPSSVKPFEQMLRTRIAVYGGGRNIAQDAIAGGVRERLVRIVADVI